MKTRRPGPARLQKTLAASIFVLLAAGITAKAQFKTVGPAPYSPAVARTKIKDLLTKLTPANNAQTISTISGLLVWFRDPADEELIAAWKKDEGREKLPEAIAALADARVAAAVVEFSWREHREATFRLGFAPMFANLMLRFPDSAKPFVDDLMAATASISGTSALDLNESEQYTVCRILLDMPDIRSWNQTALQILPHYREPAETLLQADMSEGDRDKRLRAQYWSAALRPPPPVQSQPQSLRSSMSSSGASDGNLECSGPPIPQNGEYVFHNVPTAHRRFEYDRRIWDVRLEAGQGGTQNFILTNRSSKTQKSCTIHWVLLP